MSLFQKYIAKRSAPEGHASVYDLQELFGMLGGGASPLTDEVVNTRVALSVTPINSGVTFIADQIAQLPLHLYEDNRNGRELAKSHSLYSILHDTVNSDGLTSYQWRKNALVNLSLEGRSLTFVERNTATDAITNFWELDPTAVRVEKDHGVKTYTEKGAKGRTFQAREVIDFVDKLKPDGLNHYRPVDLHKDTIGMARAVDRYAGTAFKNNGVPPMQLVYEGQDKPTPEQHARAIASIFETLKKGLAEGKQFMPMPPGYKLANMGFDPEKMQMLSVKAGLLVSIGQMLNLPPVFLQDLSKGTYANTEQQGTMLVKNTLAPRTVAMAAELNSKLLAMAIVKPKRGTSLHIEFDLDGVMRGDFKTRMEGIRAAVAGGIMTANEGRKLLNLPPKEGGDELFMQGAMAPVAVLADPDTQTEEKPAEDAGGDQ